MKQAQTICPDCGSYNEMGDNKCWKCKRPITDDEKQQAQANFESTLSDEDKQSLQAKQAEETPKYTLSPNENIEYKISREVVVTDIKMPFGSMVVFILKWAFASIPAFIILGFLASLVIPLFQGPAGY